LEYHQKGSFKVERKKWRQVSKAQNDFTPKTSWCGASLQSVSLSTLPPCGKTHYVSSLIERSRLGVEEKGERGWNKKEASGQRRNKLERRMLSLPGRSVGSAWGGCWGAPAPVGAAFAAYPCHPVFLSFLGAKRFYSAFLCGPV
jgi:hypothetical protein